VRELRSELEKWNETRHQFTTRITELVKSEEYEQAKGLATKRDGFLPWPASIEILKKYGTAIDSAQSLEDLAKIVEPSPHEYPLIHCNLSGHLEFLNQRLETKIDIAIQEYSETIESDLRKKRYVSVAERAEVLKKIAVSAPGLGIEMGDIEKIKVLSQYGKDIKKSNVFKDLVEIKTQLTDIIKELEEDSPSIPYFSVIKEYLDGKIRRTRLIESKPIREAIARQLSGGLFYAAKQKSDQLEELGIDNHGMKEQIDAENKKDPKTKIEEYKAKLRILKNTDEDSNKGIGKIEDLQSEIHQYKRHKRLEKVSRKRLDSLLSDLTKLEKKVVHSTKSGPTRKIRQEQKGSGKSVNQLLCSYTGKIVDILTFYRGVVDFSRILALADRIEDSRIICLCSSLENEEDGIHWKKLKSLKVDNLILRETNVSIPLQISDEILVWEDRMLTPAVRTVSLNHGVEAFPKYDTKRKEKVVDILSHLEEFGYKISDYFLNLPSCLNRCIAPLKEKILVDISIIMDNLELLEVSRARFETPPFGDFKEKFIQEYPDQKSINRLLNKGKVDSDIRRFVRMVNYELEKIKGERELVYVGMYKDLSRLVVNMYLMDFFMPLNGSQFIVSKLNYDTDFSMGDLDLMDYLSKDYGKELPKEYIVYDTFSYQLKGSVIEIPCFNLIVENDNLVPRKNGRPLPYTKHMLVEDTEKETTLYLPSLASGVKANSKIKKSMDTFVAKLIKKKHNELNPNKEINVKPIDWYVTDALVISRK